jgi:YbbR domain-containing protein
MRDFFIKDLGWKLFSLFLALAIWLTVHKINEESQIPTGAGPTVTIEGLPVMVVSSQADVRDFRVAPGLVTVTVSSSSEAMARMDQVHAIVDLTDVTNLTAGKSLTRPVTISAPAGVALVSVVPASVDINPPKR